MTTDLATTAETAASAAVSSPRLTGAVVGSPRIWLRLEGLAGLVAGAVGYGWVGGDWLLFVPALLFIDASMLGYLVGSRPGAVVYNVFHNWFTAIAVLGLGLVVGVSDAQLLGWVLVAHVGMDRLAGYGLKYASGFGDTHLGWIGRRRA